MKWDPLTNYVQTINIGQIELQRKAALCRLSNLQIQKKEAVWLLWKENEDRRCHLLHSQKLNPLKNSSWRSQRRVQGDICWQWFWNSYVLTVLLIVKHNYEDNGDCKKKLQAICEGQFQNAAKFLATCRSWIIEERTSSVNTLTSPRPHTTSDFWFMVTKIPSMCRPVQVFGSKVQSWLAYVLLLGY